MSDSFQKRILNIGILAHVDAGKTTLTENLLHHTGFIKNPGSVDKGTTASDYLEIEKKRGISVRTASLSLDYEDIRINLIDTPGHVDFSSEIDRTLPVIDFAIVLVSAVEGVQALTSGIIEKLKELGIPFLICVNKTDRAGADFELVVNELENDFKIKAFPLYFLENEGSTEVKLKAIFEKGEDSGLSKLGLENISEFSETILEKYIESQEIAPELIVSEAKAAFKKDEIVPVMPCSFKNNIGISELLMFLISWPEIKTNDLSNELMGIVFKLEYDSQYGYMAHFRLFSGKLSNKMEASNESKQETFKIDRLAKVFAGKMEMQNEILTNDTGIILGNHGLLPGNIIGKGKEILKKVQINTPLLLVGIEPLDSKQIPMMADALSILNKEDPELNFEWNREDNEMTINLMGEVQSEIIVSVLKDRFSIEAQIINPTVIYKETPLMEGEGYARYWMPKPCWAILKLKISPGKRGSGVVYKSELTFDKIQKKYQNEIERTIPKALKQGIKGWEVTDIVIELIDGEDHEVHSRPGDFVIATPMAIMNGLKEIGTSLLEPIYSYDIIASEELLGSIASDLTNMRAEIGTPEIVNGKFRMKGSIPVSEAMKYPAKFSSITGGKGKIRFSFTGYEKCSDNHGKIREYKGVNPLDESKWILHARGAYKADERK